MKLSHSVSGAIRQFSYWIANGTVYAIFINNLEVDENGEVLNAKYAAQRVAQYIKQWCVKDYKAEPTFDGSEEIELY